jgi:hypothetical protein
LRSLFFNLGIARPLVLEAHELSEGRLLCRIRFAFNRRWEESREVEMDRRKPLGLKPSM